MDFTRNRQSELIILDDELTIGERVNFKSDIRGKLASGEARFLVSRLKAEGAVIEGYQDHRMTLPREARSVPYSCGECSRTAYGTTEHRNWNASPVASRIICRDAMGSHVGQHSQPPISVQGVSVSAVDDWRKV